MAARTSTHGETATTRPLAKRSYCDVAAYEQGSYSRSAFTILRGFKMVILVYLTLVNGESGKKPIGEYNFTLGHLPAFRTSGGDREL